MLYLKKAYAIRSTKKINENWEYFLRIFVIYLEEIKNLTLHLTKGFRVFMRTPIAYIEVIVRDEKTED